MKHSFSISEALSFGWNTFKKNWKFWTIAMIFAMSISGSAGGYDGGSSDSENKSTSINQASVQTNFNEGMVNLEAQNGAMPFSYNAQNAKTDDEMDSTKAAFFLLAALLASPFIIVMVIFGLFSAVVLNCLSMGFNKLCLDAVRGNELKYETLLSIVNLKKSLKYLGAGFLYFLIVFIGFFLLVVPGIYWAIKYHLFYLGIVDKNYGIFDSFKYSARLTSGVKFKLIGYMLLVGGLFIVGLFALFIGAFFVAIVVSLASTYIYETLRKQLEEENVPAEAVQVAVN